MMHPDTELRYVSEAIGYGVFATRFIPKGTIVYTKDPLEIEIAEEQFAQYPTVFQDVIEKYSYVDERGIRIISWDHAKYVNHCCDCNTMSTGYGFEIAIRDIEAGEEITDEYGLLNLAYAMPLYCDKAACRCEVSPADFEDYGTTWDLTVKHALSLVQTVRQPLWTLLDDETQLAVMDFLREPAHYRSVFALKWEKPYSANGDNGFFQHPGSR